MELEDLSQVPLGSPQPQCSIPPGYYLLNSIPCRVLLQGVTAGLSNVPLLRLRPGHSSADQTGFTGDFISTQATTLPTSHSNINEKARLLLLSRQLENCLLQVRASGTFSPLGRNLGNCDFSSGRSSVLHPSGFRF